MKKITTQDAKDKAINGLMLALGVIGSSAVMKVTSKAVPAVSPWAPIVAILGGYGLSLFTEKNSIGESLAYGVIAGGSIDGTSKLLNKFAPKVPFLAQFTDYVPALSGPGEYSFPIIEPNLRGNYTPAVVVDQPNLR